MVFSSCPLTLMTSSNFITAMKLRCGQLRFTPLPTICCCGQVLDHTVQESLTHLLHCSRQTGYTWSHRHNLIVTAIKKVCARYGLSFTAEPTFYHSDTEKRPDLTFHTLNKSIAVDVVCTDPTSDSHLAAAQTMGAAAQASATAKNAKHKEAVEGLGHLFFPLAFEVFGHMHSDVDRFISRLQGEVPEALAPSFKKEMLLSLACAIQSGNAYMLQSSARLLLGHRLVR